MMDEQSCLEGIHSKKKQSMIRTGLSIPVSFRENMQNKNEKCKGKSCK